MQLFQDQIRFGIHAGQQNITPPAYLRLWQQAELLGYDWASCFDHFMPIQTDPEGTCLEGLTLLSALAAHTSSIRCGILVVGVTYRNPAVLAKIASTIDHVSGGRLELGIGAAWYELEHNQYGIPFPPPAQRIRMLGEAVKILKSLWTEHRTTFNGRYYTLTDALSEPKPLQQPHIPIWIGGSGEQLTLRVVAESADGWNGFRSSIDEYQHKLDVLARHCRDVGRDPGDIRKSLGMVPLVRETEAEVEERLQELSAQGSPLVQTLKQQGLVGTPDQCVEQLRPYLELGVGDFLLLMRVPYDMLSLEVVAKRVAPALKAESTRLLAARS
jgi:F420-dependent oxidoreductase-like protein